MPRDNADRDAKCKQYDEIIQKAMEATNTIIELEAKLLHVEAQLNDKRNSRKDEQIIIKKFFGKDGDSMPMENKALVKFREEDVKGTQNLLKTFEDSMHNEIKQIYSETVVAAEVAEEMGYAADDDSESTNYCRWLKENVPMDSKEKAEEKEKIRQHIKALE